MYRYQHAKYFQVSQITSNVIAETDKHRRTDKEALRKHYLLTYTGGINNEKLLIPRGHFFVNFVLDDFVKR